MDDIKAPPISPNNVQQAEFVRAQHVAEIPPGVSLASVLKPEFWAHCGRKFKPYALVECRAQDNKWIADLMVHTVGEFGVGMWVKNYVDLEAHAVKAADVAEYTVSFAPKHRWRVIRTSDGAVVHKDAATEADAEAWLKEHQMA